MATNNSAGSKGEQASTVMRGSHESQEQSSAAASFWLSLLDSETSNLDIKARQILLQAVQSSLEAQFVDSFSEGMGDLLTYGEDFIDDTLVSERRRIKRDERKTQKKEDLLQEEVERLESFRPARRISERDEKAELDKKLHPYAQRFLTDDIASRNTLSLKTLETLGKAKRQLESLEEALLPYEPKSDEFLQELLARLKPREVKRRKAE